MSIICPSVTADDPHTFRTQIERIQPFARRMHIDIGDGTFAPKLVDIANIYWPEGVEADIHLMCQQPMYFLGGLISMRPHLVIIHAESDGNFKELVESLKSSNIKIGVALLESTRLEVILPEIDLIDHILIFSGKLGHFGGVANLDLLTKVKKIKSLPRPIEVGWDGGINEQNVGQLAAGGVDVMNVGGFIQRSDDPVNAYAKLNLALMDGQ